MAQVIKAPKPILWNDERIGIFLAGSIEMGTAVNWQVEVEETLKDMDMIIYNPRRDVWDPTWKQEKDNPLFFEQVEWELDALEEADLIVMYFDPNTKSPITLLELGLYVGRKDMIVCCPEGYWGKGNVDIVCERYGGVVVVDSLEDLLRELKEEFDYLRKED